MRFTLSNLLHNFPNGKHMLFSLLKKKKKIHVKYTDQLDPTRLDPQPD